MEGGDSALAGVASMVEVGHLSATLPAPGALGVLGKVCGGSATIGEAALHCAGVLLVREVEVSRASS